MKSRNRVQRTGITMLALAWLAIGCGGGGAALPTENTEGDGAGGASGGGGVPADTTSAPPPPPPPSGTLPMQVTISTVDRYFVQPDVHIAVGGTVTFVIDDNWHDISFDPVPPGGNIARIEEGESVTRTFPVAGTYRFRCGRHEDGGTIHVGGSGGDNGGGGNGGGGGGGSTGGAVVTTTSSDTFSPASVTIVSGESVTWQFSGSRHNVTFRAAQPTGGSIPDTEGGAVSRTFVAAGTYPYDCTRHTGMSGTVTVQ